jgi:quinol monooxygenase YgiN
MVCMTFRPEAVGAFLAIWEESRASIRAQPGCIEVQLYKDHTASEVYYTLSRWATMSDLDAYRRSGVFGAVWPKTKALFAVPAQTFSLDAVPEVAPNVLGEVE